VSDRSPASLAPAGALPDSVANFALRFAPAAWRPFVQLARIDRPAIAGIWPTTRGESIVLDVGATIGADARHLVDLAVMGAAMARILFHIERPSVGLLNVGVEDMKGVEDVKLAARMLRENDYPNMVYHGFVEGDDIGHGTVDVVVTEGFAGNIALKTAEGTAKQLASFLRDAMKRTWMTRLGYILARSAFHALREKLDPRKSNGGVFLGLNGIVIKSHGGTDALGFASAVDLGYDMVKYQLLSKITETLARDDSVPAHPIEEIEE
jgi:glycerol-3-phosphate acyltransferase PlsX